MKSSNSNKSRERRGFTLIELIVAGVITAFILSSVSMTLSQLGRAKNTAKRRFDAFMRADTALNNIRRDIAAMSRRDDLFYARFLILHDSNSVRAHNEQFQRDSVLLFNTRVRATRNIDFSG